MRKNEQLYRKYLEIGAGAEVAFSHRPGKVFYQCLSIDSGSRRTKVTMES